MRNDVAFSLGIAVMCVFMFTLIPYYELVLETDLFCYACYSGEVSWNDRWSETWSGFLISFPFFILMLFIMNRLNKK